MQNIKVSIIVPVYNTADYLNRCLNSCVNQTLQEIEVIVVNDCSPDPRDGEIMREYEKKFPNKVRCFWHEKNKRQGGARNTGIRAACGEFLYFADSDDYLDLKLCEKMYNAIIAENADMAVCDCNCIEDKIITENWSWSEVGNNGKFDSPDLCNRIKDLKMHNIWLIVIRKSVIQNNNLYFPEHTIADDLASILWFVASSKIVRLNEALYYYVKRPNSISNSHNMQSYALIIKSIEYILSSDYFSGLDFLVKKQMSLYLYKLVMSYIYNICMKYPAEFINFCDSVLALFKLYKVNYDENIYVQPEEVFYLYRFFISLCYDVCIKYPAECVNFCNSILALFKMYKVNYDDNIYAQAEDGIWIRDVLCFIELNIGLPDFYFCFIAFCNTYYTKQQTQRNKVMQLKKLRSCISPYIGKRLTIWGCGHFGKQNAENMSLMGIEFEITDINTKIHGKSIANVVVKPWDELKDCTDIVLVSAKGIFDEVNTRLSKECPSIKVVDLIEMLEYMYLLNKTDQVTASKQYDILLLNPPYWSFHIPFLAIPCLSAALKKNGFKVGKSDVNIIYFNDILQKNTSKQQIQFMQEKSFFYSLTIEEKESFECLTYEEYKSKMSFLCVPNFTIYTIKNILHQLDKGQLNILWAFLARTYEAKIPVIPQKITRQSLMDNFEQLDREKLINALNMSGVFTKNTSHIIGLSVITEQQFLVSLFYAMIIKKINPNMKIILGGSYVDIFIKTKSNEDLAVLFSFVDYLSFQEGETCIIKLMDYLVRGIGILADIPNLVYFENETIYRTTSYIEDFSSLPPPDFSDICFEQYLFPGIMIPYQTSRGCYYGNCAFCNHDESYRKNYRIKPVESAISELKTLKNEYDIGHISFSDEAIHPDYFIDLVNALDNESQLKDVKWLFYSRVSKKFTPDIVKKAYKCGCRMVLFGVETFNQRLLNHIKKGINAETSIENIKLFHNSGITVYIWMMATLPTQTKDELLNDLAQIENLKSYISGLAIGRLGLFKSCDMYKNPEKYGIIKLDELNIYNFVSTYDGKIIDRNEIDDIFNGIVKLEISKMHFLRDRYFAYIKEGKISNPYLHYFEIHLTEHCNLKCRGCFHFSPLAEEYFLPVEIFTKDFERVAELTKSKVGRICLMGGEPLLHPNIEDMCIIARKLFPDTDIAILTNGTKLLNMKDTFFENCRKHNIKIMASKYPKINWEKIEDKLSKFGIILDYHSFQGGNRVVLGHHCLDLQGKQDIKNNFQICHRGNTCITLKNGRFFTCIMPAHIEHFNKYFNEKLEVTYCDYIDIYKAKNINEILNFLVTPPPLLQIL